MRTPLSKKPPSFELRLAVLAAIDYAPGQTIRERIHQVSQRTFTDQNTGIDYRFTWRTIETWLYRYKKRGVATLERKTRSDKNTYRKVKVDELAAAIDDIRPHLRFNKTGIIPKIALYRALLEHQYFVRSQLSQTAFYRMVRQNKLLEEQHNFKLRQSFSMRFANELWQGDTLYGPSIQQANGKWRKTYFIAFLDDATRVVPHGEFFYQDNTSNMIQAFRTALYKRGKPERLYFDNGPNYTSKEIHLACLRLNIRLSHTPVRDGAAKGKIERFFRGFRDRFLVHNPHFNSLEELNEKALFWIENHYNNHYHTSLHTTPLERFNLDRQRIQFLTDDEYTEEVFFIEENRKVSKTNTISINKQFYECPVDLRGKNVQVRFDRNRRHRFIVYFNEQRMGEATLLDPYFNAQRHHNPEETL